MIFEIIVLVVAFVGWGLAISAHNRIDELERR